MLDQKELARIALEKEAGSQVKLTGEIAWEHAEKERAAAIGHLGKDMKLDGFRPGNIPEKVLVQEIGEMALLQEMAFRAVVRAYPEIVKEYNLDVIGYPNITLTKVAVTNPVGFTIIQAVVPEVTLPDYNAIAKKVNIEKEDISVTDEDVEKQIKEILQQKASWERMQNIQKLQQEGKDEKAKKAADAELEIPELNDEFVKTLGQPDQFTNVEDFKKKIREHLEIEKKQELESKHRAKLTDTIIEETTIDVPQLLIDQELQQSFAQMEDELTRANLNIDDYLKKMKKTREELAKEWTPGAEKRAKLQLVLDAIAEKEKLTPDATRVTEETTALLERFKDADKERVETYVVSMLKNAMVMDFLLAIA